MDALQALKTTFLFRDVPEPILKLVATCAEEMSLPGGDPVANEDQAIDALGQTTPRAARERRDAPSWALVGGTYLASSTARVASRNLTARDFATARKR